MDIENSYDSLFIIANSVISLSNIIFFMLLMHRFKFINRRFSKSNDSCLEINDDSIDSIKISSVSDQCIEQEAGRADVLISRITEKRLVREFEKAQESCFFLKKGVSLNDLELLLGTNRRYVSYILNKCTGMDFNRYVQHARVEYLIECVERDPDLLNLKFSVLSEKLGFSSISKFSSVFKAVKGISPSEYFDKVGHKI